MSLTPVLGAARSGTLVCITTVTRWILSAPLGVRGGALGAGKGGKTHTELPSQQGQSVKDIILISLFY